jgi:ATP-dependent DNA helicase PIF1
MSLLSLNTEQAAALHAVQHGRNIFLTGAGGTGKSHTIRAITEWAHRAGLRYAVTALTGCAALLLNCGAKTLHSWGGVGLARESPATLVDAIKRNRRAARRWTDTQLLIVDEVSMMSPDFLEKLDCVARRIRKRPEQRFGGLQLVLAGDFCQLPPVTRDTSGGAPKFIFEMPLWSELIDETVYLRQILRQTDPVFQTLLNEARLGTLTPASVGLLEKRMGLPWQENEIRPTLLFSRNTDVDEVNRRNMEALTTERRTYEAQTVVMDTTVTVRRGPSSGPAGTPRPLVVPPDDPDVLVALERLDADAPYDPKLELAIGAQVMLIVNLDQDRGLVNGSRGVVTGFSDGGLPLVKFLGQREPILMDRSYWWLDTEGIEGIGRGQIPLRVAYAITIHKSQGATLDCALIDIGSSTFEYGQAYVALSRVRSLEGLYVWKLDPRKIRCHAAVAAFYAGLPSVTAPVTAVGGAGTAAVGGAGVEDADPTPPAYLDTALIDLSPAYLDTALTDLSPAWLSVLRPYIASSAGLRLQERLAAQALSAPVLPAAEDTFAALRACPDPAAVRVVILGQDPYPTAGHAHGLAFSVRSSVVKLPPSLVNIYKELSADLGVAAPTNGCLQGWAEQGVLLLNDILTVIQGARLSHAGIGWEELTTQILATVLTAAPHVVVIAWGANAQKKLEVTAVFKAIRDRGHTVLKAPHPSPLSAHTGFFGSRPFSQANAALVAHGLSPIGWVVSSSVPESESSSSRAGKKTVV